MLADFDAPRSFTIIDIKIVDPAAASYVNSTSKSALHRHRTLEAAGPRDYFGPSQRPPPSACMRVVTFVVSTFDSLGAQAEALIKDIGRRTNLFVPYSLAQHETSWATSSITTYLRSVLTLDQGRTIRLGTSVYCVLIRIELYCILYCMTVSYTHLTLPTILLV